MMNLPYFLFRNIDKIAYLVQKKPYPQQLNNIYHYSLIKIIVLHHLNLLNIPWETFIAHEMFKGPQIPSPVHQEEGGPSSHGETREEAKETKIVEVPVYLTYQRGTRRLFATIRQVFAPQGVEGALPSSSVHMKMLSPQGVEGDFPSTSTKQVQVEWLRKGKEKV